MASPFCAALPPHCKIRPQRRPSAAIPGRSRPQIRRLHHLPHRHRQPTMHTTGTVQPRMHRLPRRQFRRSPRRRHRARTSPEYLAAKQKAHLSRKIRIPQSLRNPRAAYTNGSPKLEYIKFVNPGDLRVAPETCGTAGCHASEVRDVSTSMMTHGAMLWGAALYNNGAYPAKNTRFGESYDRDGKPQSLKTFSAAHARRNAHQGRPAVSRSAPALGDFAARQRAPRLRTRRRKKSRNRQSQPRRRPGKPDDQAERARLRHRAAHRSRLPRPAEDAPARSAVMSLPGTNDQPGDYRASGCTACHVVYANDRDRRALRHLRAVRPLRPQRHRRSHHSQNESGHPIKHQFTRSIPSSQCMVCHMHPGTNMVTTYFGYTWWDNETDGDHMYPPDAAQSQPKSSATSPVRAIPKLPPRAACGPTMNSSAGRQPGIQRQAASTRSSPTSTATAGSSAPSSSTIAKATCSTRTATPSPSTIPTFAKAVHLRTSISKKACTASIATSSRTPRQRQTLRRTAHRRRNRLRRLPRHHSPAKPP